MRRLEEALHVRAERGTPMGSDELIHRLNLELSGEAVTLITVPAEEAAMLTTEDNRIAPPTPPSRWPRFAAAFAAGLVLLIAAVGVPLLLFGGPDETVTEPTTTSAASTTTQAPATTLPPMVESWQRVGAEVMEPAWAILDMTHTPSGFVAVGFDPSAGDSAEGLVFSSPEGVTWSRLAEDDAALTDGTVIIYGLTEGGPGLVAGGISCQEAVKPCTVRPTVWTSVDGASWTRSDPDSDIFTESGAMLDVVAFDGGVVAVGNIDEIAAEGTFGARPAVWFSEDGLEWSRVFDGAWVDNIDVGVTGPHAVGTTPDGLLVGVGSAENQAGDAVAAVWVSPDGRAWERVATESFATGTAIADVAWGPQGLIAVGSDGDSKAAIWQSPDGYSWSRVDAAGQSLETTGELSTIAALADGYVTGGPGFGQGAPIALWTSPDGTTWNRVQTIEGSNAHAVVVTENGIAVAGTALETAAVWVGPVFDPYAPPPDPQPATPTTEAPEEVALPGPELEWERIESEALDPGLIWAAASSDETIVAVGWDYDWDGESDLGETPNGVVWVSADGVDWTRIDNPEIFGGDGPQIIWGVVSGPSGFVASGDDGANSVLWFSADGYTWQRVLDDSAGLVVALVGPRWIAATIEADALTGVYFTSVDGIDWVAVSDQEEAAALDAELHLLGDDWRSPYAPLALADRRLPATAAPTGGDGPWDYAWNGDQVMAVARNTLPDIWVSPDAGLTWYEVDNDQSALDGPYPATQTLGVEFFDGKYVVVGFVAEAAAVWHGIWPEAQEG